MPTIHRGSCLCGKVTYEVAGEFERFFLCHCSRCRKGTGSAHASNLFSSNATLTWLSGEDGTKNFRVEGAMHGRNFCTECGSAMPRTRDGMVVVPAGSLDTPLDMRPIAHIFTASRADWDDHLEDLPSMDGPPV